MYKLVKPIFFSMDPESAHHTVTGGLKMFSKIWGAKKLLSNLYTYENPNLAREVFGLKFKNPVGLAAGFDKNAEYIKDMANFGFGFIEIGTVTPRPQPGNDQPRMFRLIPDKALINRMGFNNQGADVAANRLKHLSVEDRKGLLIGGNIGKNKLTPNEQAIYSEESKAFEKQKVDASSFISWTKGYISFEDTPITEALKRIERYYNLSFKLYDDVSFRNLTCTGKIILSDNLDNVLTALTLISSTSYRREDNLIYIYK